MKRGEEAERGGKRRGEARRRRVTGCVEGNLMVLGNPRIGLGEILELQSTVVNILHIREVEVPVSASLPHSHLRIP